MCNCKKGTNQPTSKITVAKGTSVNTSTNEYKITEINGKTFISKR